MKRLILTLIFLLSIAVPMHAELNYSIDLIQSGIRAQSQWNPSWGAFPIGPSDKRVPGGRVNIARCGCFITSLSTAAEALSGGGFPWFVHDQFTFGGFTAPAFSFSPKYIDDYLNIGPGPLSPRAPGWGYAGGGGTTCGVAIYPWASAGFMDPIREPLSNNPLTPTGLTWDTFDNFDATARAQVDNGLAEGRPTIVGVQIPNGGGHANLIVGWDNTEKKYLIFDPMWGASRGAKPMGTDWPQGATSDQKYSNYINSIVSVMPLRTITNGSRWFMIKDDPEPIELRMTDPRGRRTGHDPLTGKHIQEDSLAFYSEFTSWADPLGELPEAEPLRYIAARDPEAGVYGLEVFGTGSGPFTLTLETVNMDQSVVAATIAGNITAGETKRYEITYSATGTVAYVAVPAFAPIAKAGNDFTAYVGSNVAFDGRGSRQIAGNISAYAWNFGDGTSGVGAQQTHAYAVAGVYTATLTVTNSDGATANDSRTVTVVVPGSQQLKETVMVSVDSVGVHGNAISWFGHQVTPDGRYVVFVSRASNLVANDTNGVDDTFVKDLLTGAVERVNVTTGGEQSASGVGALSAISADGRAVAFFSSNLVAGSNADLFVHDRLTGVTQAIAQTNPSQGTRPSLSGDGRYLAFTSTTPLLPSASNNAAYIYDRQSANLEVVSSYDGRDPRISADGRFVAYTASFGPDILGSGAGVYLKDRQTGVTEVVSRSVSGVQVAGINPSISANGRFVSFAVATNSFPSQRNVFVRDRQAGLTEQINIGPGLANVSFAPAMDASGRFVTFLSTVTSQAYLRDRQAGTTEMASVANDGTPPSFGGVPSFGVFDSSWFSPSVASNGEVVFMSNASNLVPDDTNNDHDIFIRRLIPTTGGGSAAPIANLGGPYLGWATSAAVTTGVRIDGSGSLDPQGRALNGHWDFGDGSPTFDGGLTVNHAYAKPGVYQVTLTVNSGSDTSTAAHTEVEVLPSLASDGISIGACSPKGGAIPFDGAASGSNASLIANGWDTSTGPVATQPVTVTLPWGQVQVPTTLPGLTFKGSSTVPAGQSNGAYVATISGGLSAAFQVPCATIANLPPIAVAGGPIYLAQAGTAVTLNGSASSDPENAPLTYRWDFGDGTFGTGPFPVHTYEFGGNYFITLKVNDGTQDSAAMIGTRSFAVASVSARTQQFQFNGFFAPVDNLPIVNVATAGSAIPIKFSLGGDRGLNIFATGYPRSQEVPCDSTAQVAGIEETMTAGGSSLSYDAGSDRYIYVWKTEKAWKGKCRILNVRLSDGTDHFAKFKFR